MRRPWPAAAATLVLVLGACGSSDPGVSVGAARTLHGEIAALRAAATGRDRAATTAQADRIEALIARLRATDAIDAAAARRLRTALAAVRARITLLPVPTTTPTSTTTTTTTTEPEHHDEHGKGRSKGKGHDD